MNKTPGIWKNAVFLLLITGNVAVHAMVEYENQQYCTAVDAERALDTTRQMILREMENRARIQSPFEDPDSMERFGVDEPVRQMPATRTAI